MNAIIGACTVSAVSILGLRLGARQVGFFAALALAFDGPSIVANRSVLLETLQTFVLVLCATFAVGREPGRRAYSALTFGLATLTKPLSLYAAPILVGYEWWRQGRRQAAAERPRCCAVY